MPPDQILRETRLACISCGKLVDPVDYFGEQPPLNNEFCIACEHRDDGLCAYCLAHWMNANSKVKFYCKKCMAEKIK